MSVNKIKISALSEVMSSDATTVVPVSTGSVLATRKITANNLIKNTATITSLSSRVSNLESGGGGGSMSGYAEKAGPNTFTDANAFNEAVSFDNGRLLIAFEDTNPKITSTGDFDLIAALGINLQPNDGEFVTVSGNLEVRDELILLAPSSHIILGPSSIGITANNKTISAVELSYLDGVTSNLQTQINNMSGGGSVDLSNYPKLDVNNTFTGINTFNTETTFRGKIDIDMASPGIGLGSEILSKDELLRLKGVSSNIQEQLNSWGTINKGYKVYSGFLSMIGQGFTPAVNTDTLINEFGHEVIWEYSDMGEIVTSSIDFNDNAVGIYKNGKTFLVQNSTFVVGTGDNIGDTVVMKGEPLAGSVVPGYAPGYYIRFYDATSGDLTNPNFDNVYIEIRVYD